MLPDYRDSARAVLGACLLDSGALALAVAALPPESLPSGSAERRIYDALRAIDARQQAADVVILCVELEASGELAAVGGREAVARLLDLACARANVESHCRRIRSAAAHARLTTALRASLAEAESNHETAEVIDFAESRIMSARDSGPERPRMEHISTIVARVLAGAARGIPTGFRAVDDLLDGLRPAELVVLAARPGVGKTALGVAIADRMARSGNPVAFASLEMASEEIAQRFMSLHGPRLWDVRHGSLESSAAAQAVSRLPLTILHRSAPTVTDLRAELRRMPDRPALLVVDYLQLVHWEDRRVPRSEQVDGITRGLKALAKEFALPVLALAQLNRSVEGDRGKVRAPVLSDLRESGGIENNADVVMFIHRPGYYDPQDNSAELIVAKQRQGQTGLRSLHFVREHATFSDVTRAW